MKLHEAIEQIGPLDEERMRQAQKRWDSIAKPLRSLGLLEDAVCRLAGINDCCRLEKKCVIVLCADNGITVQGVAQTGSEVTAILARNVRDGQTSVVKMADMVGADVIAVDVGMFTEVDGIRTEKSARGTRDFSKEPAMTRQQAEKAIETGIRLACEMQQAGYHIIAAGELGIGNTTTSSAVASVLLGQDPARMTGRGAGLSDAGLQHKIDVIRAAIQLHRPDPADPIDVLCKVGGFDIAAIAGVFLGGAACRLPVVADGLISSVGALIAARLCPQCASYMLASHTSQEPAARLTLEALGLEAPLHCRMALGEGTGAVAVLPLLDMALNVFTQMPTFDQMKIESYEPLK